jgi:hypothetical protein
VNRLVKWFAVVTVVVWVVWIAADLALGEPGWVVWLIRAVLTAVIVAGCAASWNSPLIDAPNQATLPENVRFELDDGATEVVNLAYLGYRHGYHSWGILREVPVDACALRADNKPSRTVIFAMRS